MTSFKFNLSGALAIAIAPHAFGSLILLSPTPVASTGNGLGSVPTILSITHQGNATLESGCVSPLGISPVSAQNPGPGCSFATNVNANVTGVFTAGNVNQGQSQVITTPTTTASNLVFVFNASVPAGSSITLQDLAVTFYNGTTALFTASLGTKNLTLTNTLNGIGNAGFEFGLDSTQAGQVNAILSSTTSIGGAFRVTGAGGQEALQVGTRATVPIPPQAVPEPATWGMMGLGLLALGRWGKKAVRG